MPVVDPLVGGPQQPLSSGHLTTQPSQKGHDLNHRVNLVTFGNTHYIRCIWG